MTVSFDAAVARFAPQLPLAVALSGGADSTALLLACARRWPGQVYAVHVNHGLQAAAADFEAHCTHLCTRLSVPLLIQRVDARHASGESPEDAARQARYKALDAALLAIQNQTNGVTIQSVALGQHADDQVETILLALSRGGGVAGLAGMPAQWQRPIAPQVQVVWHRPLLEVSALAIRQWLLAQGEAWVEDPSNIDQGYTRNRIRAQLLPALEAAFPSFRDTFARSAANCAQADVLLTELAVQDLAHLGIPPAIRALQQLSAPRQTNALRHWLRLQHATTPSAAQMEALLKQISACTTRGHKLHIKVGRGFVVRQGECLGWYNPEVLA
jgi:tRNA(Ile)-lysidine synthase